MEIKFKNNTDDLKNSFYKALFNNLYERDINSNVDSFYNLLKKRMTLVRYIYNIDLDNINDYEYMKFINSYYSVNLDFNEYIDIYNKTNNKNYIYCKELKTNIKDEIPIFDNKELGIKSSWVLTPIKYSYEVLIDSNSNIDINKEYNINELKELVNNKDIVLLNTIYNPINEVITEYSNNNLSIDSFNICSNYHSDYFKEYIKLIRKEINNIRKLKDLKEYLLSYKKEFDDFLKEMPYLEIQKDINDKAISLINSSEEYNELGDIITKIK